MLSLSSLISRATLNSLQMIVIIRLDWFLTDQNKTKMLVPLEILQTLKVSGTCLVVQWLRFCTPNAGGLGSISGHRTRSHMLQLRVHMP